MLLGDLIARFDDETVAMETLLALDDLALLARVEEAAARQGLTPGIVAAQAVHVFSAEASDEDWVSLIGAIGRVEDPGRECLKRMVDFALHPREGGHACGKHA